MQRNQGKGRSIGRGLALGLLAAVLALHGTSGCDSDDGTDDDMMGMTCVGGDNDGMECTGDLMCPGGTCM